MTLPLTVSFLLGVIIGGIGMIVLAVSIVHDGLEDDMWQ